MLHSGSTVQLSRRFDRHIFNALDPVEDAENAVGQGNFFNDYIDVARNLFHAHGVQDTFGICLLHNHFPCGEGEKAIEREELIDGERALVTRPSAEPGDEDQAAPVSWALRDGMLFPLEYSADPTAIEHFQGAQLTADFLRDFSVLSQSSPIGQWLGLAICDRSFYDKGKQDQRAVEYPSVEARANVVFMRDWTADLGRSIETAWSLAGPADRGLKICKKSCQAYGDQQHAQHHAPA